MTEPTLVFRFIEKRAPHPFHVQGVSGRKYGVALYDPSVAAHVFRLTQSEYMKAAVDLVRGFDRPLCKFIVADIDLPAETAALTSECESLRARLLAYEPPPKPREEWTHRDWIAHAKKIEMPRAQILARNGKKAEFRKIVEDYEAAATPNSEGASLTASSPSTATAQ